MTIENITNKKLSGIYLFTEAGCLNPSTGAYRHIQVGFNELSKYADIQMLCPSSYRIKTKNATHQSTNVKKRENRFIGLLKDLLTLYNNHKSFFSLYKSIKKKNPDFIYERAAYLNFKGLIIAKLFGIQHFYEINGIQYLVRSKYYDSFFNKIAKYFEKYAYSKSNFLYIVGSWDVLLNLKKNNWIPIENGIEKDYLEYFKFINKQISDNSKINIVFIGFLMQNNHRPQILIEALNMLKNKNKIRLHLVGSNMNLIQDFFDKNIEVVNHGYLNREQLKKEFKAFHIGIIPGGEDYPSFMKIFEYGASKCLVIAPELYNLKYWFSDNEILFFEKDNVASLTLAIEKVITNQDLIYKYGENIFKTIQEKFTWEDIYLNVFNYISKFIR